MAMDYLRIVDACLFYQHLGQMGREQCVGVPSGDVQKFYSKTVFTHFHKKCHNGMIIAQV